MAQVLQRKPFRASSRAARQQFRCVTLRAARRQNITSIQCSLELPRREALLAGVASLALPLLATNDSASAIEVTAARYLAVDKLSTFQKADQRNELIRRVSKHLREVLTGADAPATIKLVLNDAATFDIATGTGGFDGSIVLPEELNRPENAALKPLVEKLAKVKEVVDKENVGQNQAPISWADLLVLAARTATKLSWRDIKLGRAATASGGTLIAENFAADWPVQLGRIDATEPAPAGRLPAADASVDEIRQFLLGLGAKPSTGIFPTKPPFWERPGFVVWTASAGDPAAEEARFAASDSVFSDLKKKYDFSRQTVTRTDYEVDFVNYFTKLTTLGAKFQPDAYLHPEPLPALKL